METRRSSKKPEPERPHIEKVRVCLMCGKNFRSRHVGERVCSRCKETAAWRSGDTAD